jgi:hypothetical protein
VLILVAITRRSEAATSTISATASNLERAFRIGNAELGLAVAVAVAALCMLPFGDRPFRWRGCRQDRPARTRRPGTRPGHRQ